MDFFVAKKKINLPMGGTERNYCAFYIEKEEAECDGLALWDLRDRSWYAIEQEADRTGGYIDRFQPDIFALDNALFTAGGGLIQIESVGEAVVYEISTPESRNALSLVRSSQELEGIIERAFRLVGEEDVFVTGHPSFLVRPARRRHFSLGYHVSVSADGYDLDVRTRDELATALISLLPLIGSGGIGPTGFVVSPAAVSPYCLNYFHLSDADLLPYRIGERSSVILSATPKAEGRVHIPLDAPFTSLGQAMGFTVVRSLLAAMFRGYSPLSGRRLARPSYTAGRWSVAGPERKARLSDGHYMTGWTGMEMIGRRLREFRSDFRLPEPCDSFLGLLLKGIAAAVAGKGARDEWLEMHFMYYRKRALLNEFLGHLGVSIERFNTYVQALRIFGKPPNMVRGMTDIEVLGRIEKMKTKRRGKLLALLRERSMDVSELRFAAETFKRVEFLDLSLGRLFPSPSPLASEDLRHWERFTSGLASVCEEPTRASARGRLVRYARTAGTPRSKLEMDWNNLFCYPELLSTDRLDAVSEVIVVPLGGPGSDRIGDPLHLKLRDEDVTYVTTAIPEAQPFADALLMAKGLREAEEKRREALAELI